MCKRDFLGVRFIGLGNGLPGGTVKAALLQVLEALKTRAGNTLKSTWKETFYSNNEQGLLQLWVFFRFGFLLLCSGQVRNDSRGTEDWVYKPSICQTHWAKEIKIDLAFLVDGKTISMTHPQWQCVLSTSFKSRWKWKRWEGILLSSK